MSFSFNALADIASFISTKPLSILVFHRVVAKPDPLFPAEMHARRFDQLLEGLKKSWCIVPLHDAIIQLMNGQRLSRSLAITFDDGYADNAEVALPILKKHQVPATIFVASGFLDGGCMWNDAVIEAIRGTALSSLSVSFIEHPLSTDGIPARQRAIQTIIDAIKHLPVEQRSAASAEVAEVSAACLPSRIMMSAEQVRAIAEDEDIEIGAHTVTHPMLAAVTDDVARREIAEGKKDLESLLQRPVELFAYPNGLLGRDYFLKHVDMVKACEFKAAFSTDWGATGRQNDFFQIPRFTPWDHDPRRFNLRLLKNLFVGEQSMARTQAI